MALVWRITDDLPNSPNFLPAKLSHYTVLYGGKLWQRENLVNLQYKHFGERKFGEFVPFPEQKYFGKYIP